MPVAPEQHDSSAPARRRGCAVLPLLLCACQAGGVVELNWAFVDRDGDPIFPGGLFTPQLRDACDMPARRGTASAKIDLGVELAICDVDCAGDCEGDCRIAEPERFACDVARTTLNDVPASSQPYLFVLRAVITGAGDPCVAPPPSCIAVPGPRERSVAQGQVTDLQVFQIAVDIDRGGDDTLDLEACGCG
ncbi:MAG: hypothetical protein IPH07_32955 [Deltaproteobacteria bacterium]|nr:hypothetical protein [Deltaproteobacteria bacterium]MBP7285337.1 hypothetical protein [Nannocystaceae bacterium]